MELIGKPFVLFRREDISGVSGVGIVCWGFQFADGKCVTRWCSGEHRQTAVWDDLEAIEAVHGHNGATVILFPDQDGKVDLDGEVEQP